MASCRCGAVSGMSTCMAALLDSSQGRCVPVRELCSPGCHPGCHGSWQGGGPRVDLPAWKSQSQPATSLACGATLHHLLVLPAPGTQGHVVEFDDGRAALDLSAEAWDLCRWGALALAWQGLSEAPLPACCWNQMPWVLLAGPAV